MKKSKKIVMISVIFLLLFLTYLFTPYVMVDVLTAKHGAEFSALYSVNGFYHDIEYLKVFQYRDEKVDLAYLDKNGLRRELEVLNDDCAVVLYIEENHSSAALFIFHDEDGKWELSSWDVVWSHSGAADGFIWPYYL